MSWPSTADGTLRPYPAADDSFAEPRIAERVLAPLVSVDLSVIDPSWTGRLPLVLPLELREAPLGLRTRDMHTFFARTGWMGFRLGSDSRLDFLGDWRFFETLHDEPALAGPDSLPDDASSPSLPRFVPPRRLVPLIEDQLAALRTGRLAFERSGVAPMPDDEWLQDVGYPRESGPWADPALFSLGGLGTDDVHPLMPNGDRFHFVAELNPRDYLPHGPRRLLAFFEPSSRTALFTFDDGDAEEEDDFGSENAELAALGLSDDDWDL